MGIAAMALAIAGAGCASGSAPAGATHALTMSVHLEAVGGKVSFLTPSNTVVQYPVEEIVGKPYLFGVFHAGFSAGNDPPTDHVWGTVPANLTIEYTTPGAYADGAYDMVFVVYKATPITPAIQSGPAQQAPAAKGGDLASFTLSSTAVLDGDPKNAIGTIRLNVKGADARAELTNRLPDTSPGGAAAAFDDTVLTIP
jgi:hypothetical protein